MPNYINKKGKSYTEEEIRAGANRKGISFDDFISTYGIKLEQAEQAVLEEQRLEKDNVDWFSQTWFGRGFDAASTTGEATDLMSQNFSNIDMESVQEFMKAKENEAKSHVPSSRMSKFQEQYVKEGKTWAAFFRGVKDQPGLLPELFVQSLGTQIGTAFDSPGASLSAVGVAAGAGAVVAGPLGALAGAMGGLATSMEAALTFGELIETRLKEKGQEFTDENIKALLEAEGTEIRNKSIGRGLTIGAIEGFSGGLAGKVGVAASKAAKGAKRAKLAAGGAGVVVEAVGGATGEILGRVVAGQEMDAAEIGFEAITGTVTAPLNVSAALLTAKQPTYKLNGASVTYEQMKNFVDTADDMDIAKADIKMENDFTGIGKKAQAKQEAAIEGVKLSGDVETIAEVASARAEIKFQDNMAFAKKHSELYGLKFTELTQEEIKQRFENTKDSGLIDSLGGVVKGEIIINKDLAKTRVYGDNVGNHELLHGIIKASKVNITQETINDFLNVIGKENEAVIKKRINDNYTPEYMSKNLDEYFTIFSDAIANEEIKFDDSVFTRVADAIRRMFANFGISKVDFESGRGAYNFLKDYNKSIHKGSLSSGVKKATSGTAVFEDTVTSKEASEKVQSIYEEKGATGAFDIIEQFKPIVSRIADKRREAPNFDKELLMSEIEIGPRGILDLIRDYKPDSGVPLAAYINKFLPARAIEASRRVLGEEFTQDVTEAKGVAAEEVDDVDVKTKPKKKTVVAERLGVSDKAVKAVKKILPNLDTSNLTFKTLKNQVPDIVGGLFGISPNKIKNKANITKGELLSSQMFINKNADLLMAMLPEGATPGGTATGVPKTLLDAFYTKTNRAKAATTGSKAGLAVQQKNKIDKTQFLETFGVIEGKPVRTDRNTSARVLALADMVGKMITNQTVRQELTKQPDNKQDITRIAEGKSEVMFSKSVDEIVSIRSLFELEGKGIDKLLKTYGVEKSFNLRKEDGREQFVKAIQETLLPLMPRDFWFGPDSTVFTSSNKSYGLSMSNPSEARIYNNLRDRIKSLKKLPDSSFGKPIIGVDNYSISAYSTIFKDSATIKKNIKNGKIKAWNKKVALIHKEMWKRFNKAITDNPENAKAIGSYLKLVGGDSKHWHKLGAQFVGYSKKIFGTRFEYEHAMPATSAYLYLIDAALSNSNFNASYNAVINNYKLIALDKKMDKKLTAVGLQRRMPEGWDLMQNNWWDRYFNELVNSFEGGIDPSSIVGLENNSFAEMFNITKLKTNESTVKLKPLNKATSFSRSNKNKPKGITVLDFDDTLATSKSLIKYTQPDGTKGTLTPEQYASTYQDLQDLGYEFDFSEFNKVVDGKVAPLFQKALKLQSKFGPENMFVLTARPAESAPAIFAFIKANGLNIPLKNITGLANSTSEAKALWIADKVGEGFNDFYFADDALQNVQAVKNMLDQFDVKSKVQQAKVKFSKSMNNKFNDILENITGIESKKRFDFIKGRKRGASKGKFRFFIPPSHEDFVGLLYNFMGKGLEGNKHRDFLEQALVRPLNRANKEYDTARQSIATDYKNLNNQFPDVKKMLIKKTPDGDFTYQDAIRIYLWDKHGYDIPGLSPVDQKNLVELVKLDGKLQAYADAINVISKQEKYVNPTDGWNSGDIRMDLDDATGRVGRAQFFEEFNENADIIFSKENLNKIEAGFGNGVREALEDILYRIKTGRNRPSGQNQMVNKLMNWVNGSVGSVMFFNMRSALLQQMSIVNYINFADNNIFAAAKAFANQKQYWADFAFIFNSDMLKQRRGGIQTDVNGAELAADMRKSKNPSRFLISKLLELGFLPTQIGDNIAIATGGASYYRNRINTYLKQGLSKKEAEAKAFTDFQDITQSTQQSARPDMVSQQQASVIGKVILNFQNVTSQFNRLGKKAFLDIKNRRITKPNTTQIQSDISNASRITYYFAVQNLIFYTLQTALFAMMFGDEEEDENKLFIKKKERLINGSIDSVLRGTGLLGGVVATLKNVAIAFARQRDVKYNPDESAVIMEALNLSPVLGIKARKISNAEKTLNYNKKVIKEMETFDIDNPQWSAVTNYVEAGTNLPLNRLYNKTQNVRQAFNNDHAAWERTLLFLGWSQYNLDLENEKMDKIKESTKAKSKSKKTSSRQTPIGTKPKSTSKKPRYSSSKKKLKNRYGQ